MQMNTIRLISMATLICLSLAACKKSNDSTISLAQSNSATFKTANLIDLGWDEITSENWDEEDDPVIINEGTSSNSVVSGSDISNTVVVNDGCKKVTYEPDLVTFPHTKIVDFGTNCTGSQGVVHSGEKIYRTEANWRNAPAGTRIGIMTMSNFKTNGLTITGSSTAYVKTQGILPGGQGSVTRVVSAFTFRDSLGNVSTFISDMDKELVFGGSTKKVKDDIYTIRGTSYGAEVKIPINPNDIVTWTAQANTYPIRKEATCAWRRTGALVINMTKANGTTVLAKLNYSPFSANDPCDNQASFFVSSEGTQIVTLPFVFYGATL